MEYTGKALTPDMDDFESEKRARKALNLPMGDLFYCPSLIQKDFISIQSYSYEEKGKDKNKYCVVSVLDENGNRARIHRDCLVDMQKWRT